MSNILETIPNHTFIFHNQGTEAPSLTDKYSSTDFVIMYGDNRITSGTEFDESFPQDANGLRFPKLANGPNEGTANTQICVFPHECVTFGSDDFTLSEWVKFDETQHTGGSGTYVYFISFAYNDTNSLVFQTQNNADTMYTFEISRPNNSNADRFTYFDSSHTFTTNLTNFIWSRSGDVVHFYMNGVKVGTHTLDSAEKSLPTPATSYTTQNSNLYTIGSTKPRRHQNHNGFNLYRTDIWKNLGITTQSEIDKIYAQGIYEPFNKPLLEKENVDIEISKNFIINKTS